MHCKKCGLFVYEEVVAAVGEEDTEYRAFMHKDKTDCICEEVHYGNTYDGDVAYESYTKKDGTEGTRGVQVPLSHDQRVVQMQAIDQAMKIYFEDGIVDGMTWQDVQEHDYGKHNCKCASCVELCKICQKRKGLLLAQAEKSKDTGKK